MFYHRDKYMEKEYLPEKIEAYVQQYWAQHKTFQTTEDSKKEKYYCLPMLPYPSGRLHMGHVRNYTISDVIARYQRMLGKNVLQPIGWDAFGLPAEEAAIKNNTLPQSWTRENIKYMKKQLKSLGFSYDWSRELTTCQPEYYRWEQWFFTKLYEKKLVYKKNSFVNWCSYDKTVLANEQVIDGCCWRCQTKIKIKKIPQWFIKIRNYAESLYQDLKTLTNWPENVKNMQKNWIGRTKGFEITLKILNTDQTFQAFTNRLDLIMNVTFIVISPCHQISLDLSKNNKTIKNFIKKYKYLSPEELDKVKFQGINTNIFTMHPLIEKKIPIWIANFSMQSFGANAMLATPDDNENDYKFAIKNGLEIKKVIMHSRCNQLKTHHILKNKEDVLYHIEELNDLKIKHNIEKIKNKLSQKTICTKKICYKLQDWCVSRQRYWGTPIPMAQLKNGKIVSIPENELPVLLPKIKKNINSVQINLDFDNTWTHVSIDGQNASREKDTFDTFMESSWYYARYTCPNFHKGMIDPIAARYWLPVDQYIGGIEHAIMHLMYFRFYHKLLRDFKLVHTDEPVKKLLCQGMVLAEAFYEIDDNAQKHWIHSSLVSKIHNSKGQILKAYNSQGKEIFYAGMIKMSKSKNNGIEPELIIKNYGADTIRLFIMFAAPVESSLEWKESSVKGVYRFLKKLWLLIFNYISVEHTSKSMMFENLNVQQSELRYQLHKTIKKVSDDISRRQSFNTAISSIMELVNKLLKASMKEDEDKYIMQECLTSIIKMLYPFTPHFCFVVWGYINKDNSIDEETWPIYNKKILSNKNHTIIIQINGKKRSTLHISPDEKKEKIVFYAQNKTIIQKYLKQHNIKKIIYIPNKIINFVIS